MLVEKGEGLQVELGECQGQMFCTCVNACERGGGKRGGRRGGVG